MKRDWLKNFGDLKIRLSSKSPKWPIAKKKLKIEQNLMNVLILESFFHIFLALQGNVLPWQLLTQSSHIPWRFLSALLCFTLELSVQACTALHIIYSEMISNYVTTMPLALTLYYAYKYTKAHVDNINICDTVGPCCWSWQRYFYPSSLSLPHLMQFGCQWIRSKDKSCFL